MADERAANRYQRLYALLLRLYPELFYSRFAESMEQTFHDLCRERQAARRGLFAFALGLFAETSAGIFRERMVQIMPPRRNLIRLALLTATILCVPLVAMRFSEGVRWTLVDFVVAAALLFGAGLAFELIARKASHAAYRVATGLAVLAAFLLVWMNLAIGLIGSGDNPANLLYVAVLAVGTIGVFAARFRPRAMARALYATALAQASVAAIAWIAGFGSLESSPLEIMAFNALFVLLFVGSALLYRRAGAIDLSLN